MTKLQQRKLKFHEIFLGFALNIEFLCKPKKNDPREIHDYEIEFVSAKTSHQYIDIHQLCRSMERVEFEIQKAIMNKAHSLYIKSLREPAIDPNDQEGDYWREQEQSEQRLNDYYENN